MPDDNAIAILPYGTPLSRDLHLRRAADLNWPLGMPERLTGGTVGDMAPTDHLLIYPKRINYLTGTHRIRAKLSMMIVEPWAIHALHYRIAPFIKGRFFRILSHDRKLVARLGNGVFLLPATSWIAAPEAVDRTKSRALSLIASAKRTTEGHRLRHEIVDWLRAEAIDADIMGRGYRPFVQKSEGLAPYRYSVVIENCRAPGYISEKLIDCLLCDTVPIYWGAPDVSDIFDRKGLILCDTADAMRAAIRGISESGYAERAAAIRANRETAMDYLDVERNAALLIRREAGD